MQQKKKGLQYSQSVFLLVIFMWINNLNAEAGMRKNNPVPAPADTVPHCGKDKIYQLVWWDDFDDSGYIDSTKWSFSKRGNPAWKRFLAADTAFAQKENGLLKLKMDRKMFSPDSSTYQSVGIESAGKFSFQYGKVEVKAKFNKGKGSWPAIWMMPEDPVAYGDWPGSGEIDIMEHVNEENVVHQTIHNASVTDAEGGSKATHQSVYKADDFNTYGMEWTPDYIRFFLNGEIQYTYHREGNGNSYQWPFDKPFYIILNQSGGAGWPGNITDSDLPFILEIDYVRVFQLKQIGR